MNENADPNAGASLNLQLQSVKCEQLPSKFFYEERSYTIL